MVSEEIIEEAAKRGIVPGAFVRSAWGYDLPDRFVPPINEWICSKELDSIYWAEGHDSLWLLDNGKWATVITPAPSSETLEPGMATKCGPAMRAAIMERAKELGIYVEVSEDPSDPDFVGMWVINFRGTGGYGKISPTVYIKDRLGNEVPAHEFLRLMENTKPPVKELTTEEKLAEAVSQIKDLLKHGMFPYDDGAETASKARAFLKSIEP